MSSYSSLAPAINDLKKKGYKLDFNIERDSIYSKDLEKSYEPHDFHVNELHRFEGASNPADNSILYAIETTKGDKGLLVDAYGAYSEAIGEKLRKKLTIDSQTKAE